MNPASEAARSLLLAVQDRQQDLASVWRHYTERGVESARRYLNLSARPFCVAEEGGDRIYDGSLALGVLVKSRSRKYDLGVELLWDARRWTIETHAWVVNPEGGQTLLRSLPARYATELDACLNGLEAAVHDLKAFDDLV